MIEMDMPKIEVEEGEDAGTCPVEAISEGSDKYVVNPDTCIDCGACEDVCPTGAIHPAD